MNSISIVHDHNHTFPYPYKQQQNLREKFPQAVKFFVKKFFIHI